MLYFFGHIINTLYNVIGNYSFTLIVIGLIMGLLRIINQAIALNGYNIKKKLEPQINKINSSNISDEEKIQKINTLLMDNKFNMMPAKIITIFIALFSMTIFVVMLNPYEYIGISKTFTESFLIYENIFDTSLDLIMPFIIVVIHLFSAEIGKPLKLINKKELLLKFAMAYFTYTVFGSILMHVYIIYYLGIMLGGLISSIIMIKPRRKAYFS